MSHIADWGAVEVAAAGERWSGGAGGRLPTIRHDDRRAKPLQGQSAA